MPDLFLYRAYLIPPTFCGHCYSRPVVLEPLMLMPKPECPDHLKKKRGGPGIRVATQIPAPPTGPPLTLGGLGIWVVTQDASDEKRFSSKMMCFQLNSNLPLVLSNPKGENQAPSTRIRR